MNDTEILAHLPLAHGLARRFLLPHLDPRDVRAEARLALVEAARKYDPTHPAPFGAYAAVAIKSRLINLVARDRLIPYPANLFAPDEARKQSPGLAGCQAAARRLIEGGVVGLAFDPAARRRDDDDDIDPEHLERLPAAIARLPAPEAAVVRMRLDGIGYREIGRRLDVSRSHVHTLYLSAKAALAIHLRRPVATRGGTA